MTSLTLVTLLLVAYGMLGRRGYGWALALSGSTAAGTAIVVGSTAIPTFYAVALGTVVALGMRALEHGRHPSPARQRLPPGVPILVLFFAWSTMVTVVAPELFNGMPMLIPTGLPIRLTAGVLTASNVAQVVYLALGVCVVLFIARSPASGPELIGLVTGTAILLSVWRYGHVYGGFPFPERFFDNSPNFTYIETAPGGGKRFRGIATEPAGLAGTALVAISYLLPRSLRLRGYRRAGALFIAGAALYLGVISTSATFVVAGVVMALIAALTFAGGFLLRRASVSAFVSVGACGLVIVALWLLPIVTDFVETTVNEKVSSSSYEDRSGSNRGSYDIFVDTFGFGAGLGANRGSSFFPSLLSTTGLIGALLFTASVAGLIRRSAAIPQYRPVIWALTAGLVLKVVAGPDLSDVSGVMWISLGLLSQAALRADQQRATLAAIRPTQLVPAGARQVEWR